MIQSLDGQGLKDTKHFHGHILVNNDTQKKDENSSSNENDIPNPPQRIHRAKRCRMCWSAVPEWFPGLQEVLAGSARKTFWRLEVPAQNIPGQMSFEYDTAENVPNAEILKGNSDLW